MLSVRDTNYNAHDALFMYTEGDWRLDETQGVSDKLTVIAEGCQYRRGRTATDGPIAAIGIVVTPVGNRFWVFDDWSLRHIDGLTPEMRREVRAET